LQIAIKTVGLAPILRFLVVKPPVTCHISIGGKMQMLLIY